LRSTTKSENFQWFKLFPCYSLLWVPDIYPKCFNLNNTIRKVIARLYFIILRSKITEKRWMDGPSDGSKTQTQTPNPNLNPKPKPKTATRNRNPKPQPKTATLNRNPKPQP